ncbi:MAG: OsmC family protein [Hyphomonas oceanitis]|uniref:OsmC family protein n=1 Tax=Hyphomonas oceanitis TaxID=81033 RepID=UPI0030036C65
MGKHTAIIRWSRGEGDFKANKHTRAHEWEFDGGLIVPASASPDIVPLPYSVAGNVDPEEAFVASISSCHMLFYLHKARDAGFVVNTYEDQAVGVMGKNPAGRMAITRVTLSPVVSYEGLAPSADQIKALHHEAHELCFIANSTTAEITTNTARS